MIIDGLAFITEPSGPGSVAALLTNMADLGISRTIVCASQGADGMSPNARTAEAVRQDPDRLTGLARVSPRMRDWRGEVDQYGDDPNFAGILLHPWEDGFAILDPGAREIIERCAAKGLPVTVAAGYPWRCEALQIGLLADKFPTTSFILTNEGQLNISGLGAVDVMLVLDRAPNVVLHTTGAYREDFLVSLVAQYGPGRLMYASGYPRFSPEYELRRIQWAGSISAAAKEHILSATAGVVFGVQAAQG